MNPLATLPPATFGRYVLHEPIARGGMATVHAARLVAAAGITRLVAAKRLHPQFTSDSEFVAMFHDEARIASRIHHRNVVPVIDVVIEGDELILVQEYVHGVPLSRLLKLAIASHTPVSTPLVVAVIAGVLAGLHAAHEAVDEAGDPLEIVHRDVSPQNVIVSVDGMPRLLDFGIAKARTCLHHTREGFFKGKLAYMPPEQLRAETVDRRADVYSAGVLLWELVVNRRFYDGKGDADFVRSVALGSVPTPVQALEGHRARISEPRWADLVRLEPVIQKAIATSRGERFETAEAMAAALLEAGPCATAAEVAAWVRRCGAEYLDNREQLLAATEESWRAHASTVRPFEDATSLAPAVHVQTQTTCRIETDELVPWALVAALLVVIGVLAGMVVARASTYDRDAKLPVAAMEEGARAHAAPPEAIAPEAIAPEAIAPEAIAPEAIVDRPPARAVRYVGPSKLQTPPTRRATPVRPARAPASASARSECNSPFYFEGTTKLVKPHCL